MEVTILQPTKSAMQSGNQKKYWILEYKPINGKCLNSNGYISNSDANPQTISQIVLKFHTAEEAVKYAQRKNLSYIVQHPPVHQYIKKSYTDAINMK
jgi:hypothetical protein